MKTKAIFIGLFLTAFFFVVELSGQDIRLGDNKYLLLRTGTDYNHGLTWKGDFYARYNDNLLKWNKLDGPFLFGWVGGGLGTTANGNKVALRWTEFQDVYIYHNLTVSGTVLAREFNASINAGADFVFDKKYNLLPLNELKKFTIENRHLPGIPSETEMLKSGVDISKFQISLLQKIEELSLYIIQLNEDIEKLKKENLILNEKFNSSNN